MAKGNSHTGSRFDAFLKEEGIYEEVQSRALGRALAEHVAATKRHRNFLDDAARAVGKVVEIKISKTPRVVSV